MTRYFVVGDPHSFCDLLIDALKEAGWYDYKGDKKIIILGDIMDRGNQPKKMQGFIMDLINNNQLILIGGNHESMAKEFVDTFLRTCLRGLGYDSYIENGTVATMSDLTDMSEENMKRYPADFMYRARQTDYFSKIIPFATNYYETKQYIFVHGYIPMDFSEFGKPWRELSDDMWDSAKWLNGIEQFKKGIVEKEKIIVFGHRSASIAHYMFDKEGSKFGPDANYKPYYNIKNGTGIIALDSHVVKSNFINCIVIDDDEINNF